MINGYIDFSKQQLPKIYKRQGKDCYLDPIREKLIFITPEETVRQQVISYLLNVLNVPVKMIDVEIHLSHYGIKSKRRVDILINKYDENEDTLEPLCVIECKAPTIVLGEAVQNQMIDYCCEIGCIYSMITNGHDVQCYHYDINNDEFVLIEELPKYLELVKGEYVELPENEILPRLEFEELFLNENWRAYTCSEMGDSITKELAIPMVNFWECLIYTEHKLPKKKFQLFTLIEDMGVRLLSYGNASGGMFQGPYRSFMIEYNGSTEIVSLAFSTYVTAAKPDIIRTCICVAIDNEKETHHALQLVVDDNVLVIGSKVTFYHHGKIGISNKGSGKVDELRQFVSNLYPEIIDGKRFNLGTLENTYLWNLDEDNVAKVIENFISYALVRDEYRNFIKKNR